LQALVKPKHEKIWLILAGLLPLVLCLVFTFIEARKSVVNQQKLTASMLLEQAAHISDLAWSMTDRLNAFRDQDCRAIRSVLQQYGTIYPYFRSVGVAKGEQVYCSSAFGAIRGSIQNMILVPPPEHRAASWMLSVDGTYSMKDRPAVVFMREDAQGFGRYALVEGQYLIDFMTAAGIKHGYHITMQFGDGYRISSGKPLYIYQGILGTTRYTRSDNRYPITVAITSPRTEALQSWRQTLFTFLPMAIILSLLFIMITLNWLKRRSSFHDEIGRGIARGEFTVHYQPVCNLATGELSGAEALLRWQRPDGSWVRPDIFIAAAEDEGMIIPLTRHLLALVAKDCASWQVPADFNIGINLAAEHLQHDEFVSDMRQFSHDIAHLNACITLELTERSLIRDGEEVGDKLAELRLAGMKVAIDDFGTGHCSLSYLQTFPIDYLKIDKGFVNAIETLEGTTPVLDAIILLAQKLALNIVAEGVETTLQREYLKNRGVEYIQGYYYARPMNNAALMQWIAQQPTPSAGQV